MRNDLFDGMDNPQPKPSARAEIDEAQVRSLLDGLIEESKLYKTTKDYQDLLDFTVKLRNFAPFNAMLLNIQKPGLSYAASAMDWLERFNRVPKRDARPLLILWPFGPVALVYDIMDTEGDPLPKDAEMFPARGEMSAVRIAQFTERLEKKNVESSFFDGGDAAAGSVELVPKKTDDPKEERRYQMRINNNHNPVTQFVTMAHELGHLCLGHLGRDGQLNIPKRPKLNHEQREIEAESVAYIVCQRQNIEPRSQTYLSTFVNKNSATGDEMQGMDFYQVMRAAGQVEALLGLGNHVQFTRFKVPRDSV